MSGSLGHSWTLTGQQYSAAAGPDERITKPARSGQPQQAKSWKIAPIGPRDEIGHQWLLVAAPARPPAPATAR
jgi:hypothetical protein